MLQNVTKTNQVQIIVILTVTPQLQHHLTFCVPERNFCQTTGPNSALKQPLIRATNNQLIADGAGHVSILLLLDLMAAFHRVCHNALGHQRHCTFFGLRPLPLK